MKNNWVLVAIIAAVLAVPFVLALRDETSGPADHTEHTEDQTDGEQTAVIPQRAPEEPPAVDASAGWKVAAIPDRAFYDDVLLSGPAEQQPALGGALTGLALGMTRDEAKLAAPGAVDWQTSGSLADHPGATLWLDYKGPGNTLSRAMISFPDDNTALPVLIGAWGEPQHSARLPDGPVALWLDPETRTRALVMQWQATKRTGVSFASYTPTRELIAPNRKPFGFETRPLLGASKGAVLRAYADRIIADSPVRFQIQVGLTEYASEPRHVIVHLEADKVVKIEFAIEYRLRPGAYTDVLAMLETKLGKPTETEPGGRFTTYERRGQRVTVERRADTTLLFVTIERR